jgi:CheY-like chemotaxis protein
MPEIESIELVRYMKTENRLKRIPIVIVAALESCRAVSECFDAGAIASLYKPLKPKQLLRTVQIVLAPRIAKRQAA